MASTSSLPPLAAYRGVTARGLRHVTDDPRELTDGRWAVCLTFEGAALFARFDRWTPDPPSDEELGAWAGPAANAWTSSLTEVEYRAGVEQIRERIAAGDVYQVNLCRVLSAPLDPQVPHDVGALSARVTRGNPAPYGAFLRVPGLAVASASPELFLRREGALLTTGPIKGTARTAAGLTAKDRAENVMIVDLMRNDLARVCRPGSVHVPHLLAVEEHPGLVHLVSTVAGVLRPDQTWADVLMALHPPGSVSGAPKLSALDVIRIVEPVARGPYCGAFGWIDTEAGTAELAVAIRTFWLADGRVCLGTGAGITWGSDPAAEWGETELKAARLVGLASRQGGSDP